MTIEERIELRLGLRSVATSKLIALMNADAMVDMFNDIGAANFTAEERKEMIQAIADEIDERIPSR